MLVGRKLGIALAIAGAAALLGACSSTATRRAPVEDRGMVPRGTAVTAATPAPLPPGAENAGKPGYYTVQPGEGLMKVARDHNQNWRDIVRWNNLDNPDHIEAGQVLRVEPPPAPVTAAVAPVAPPPARPPAQPTAATPQKTGPASAPVATQTPVSSAPPPASREMAFIWPASGTVVTGFDGAGNKGLDIAGKSGDSVLAAADGKVIYVGIGATGSGNLIIITHNDTFLTAYYGPHGNQTPLVKENQMVKKGQKIAEMGSSGPDRVSLHFEIRRSDSRGNKPVDPARYLPAR